MNINSFEWTCNKWGFFITISKLQIIIIDKQLATCQREINTYKEGGIINTRLEISQGEYVHMVLVYGIPHSFDNRVQMSQKVDDENIILQKKVSTSYQNKHFEGTKEKRTNIYRW